MKAQIKKKIKSIVVQEIVRKIGVNVFKKTLVLILKQILADISIVKEKMVKQFINTSHYTPTIAPQIDKIFTDSN
jgi:hypothetical protein